MRSKLRGHNTQNNEPARLVSKNKNKKSKKKKLIIYNFLLNQLR